MLFSEYARPQSKGEILISAAASLKESFKEIGDLFEKQTGIRAQFNLGASGLLQKQIETGAPADVFASAGEKQMDELQRQGLILAETRRDFAHNELALVVPSRTGGSLNSFKDLVRPGIAKIAIGNPKTVPVGQYSQETLQNLGLWDSLQSRFIMADNVRQVLDYVEREEVDAGIVYESDIAASAGKVKVACRAPQGSHGPIVYPIAIVKASEKRREAQQFVDLVNSSAGQAIIKKYGFLGAK
jgi:molybdate transport system substrate-binding protein